MTLKLHRPDGEGGLEPRQVPDDDWQAQLRSPRWGSGLGRARLPDLKNAEMNPELQQSSSISFNSDAKAQA